MHKKNIIVNKRLIQYLFLFCIATAQMQEVNAIGGRLFCFLAGNFTGLHIAHQYILKLLADKKVTQQEKHIKEEFVPFATAVFRESPVTNNITQSEFVKNVSKFIATQFIENEKSKKTAKEEIKK